tara:strand:- start:419 stop:940 length:522 start_codon:yes stop_codon:yes gene_type:complete
MNGKSKDFRKFDPNINDWVNHMSTVFPEVRLKSYIELRGADGGPWSRVCALPAFWTGILYDDEMLDNSWELVKKWDINEIKRFYQDVRLKGMRADYPGKGGFLDFIKKILEFSSLGLKKRNINHDNKKEDYFLSPLLRILESRKSPAEKWRDLFLDEWSEDVDKIYQTNYFKI